MNLFQRRHTALVALVLLAVLYSPASAEDAPPKRYVIIHGDDAGMSHSANRATIDALEQGVVSSASIMVPCAWFPEFAAYAKSHPDKDYGIHLTLNCEWDNYRWGPVAPRELVPSLLDKDGYLWHGTEQTAANAKAAEVEIELRAQIDRAKQFGVPLSHLDTHMGTVFSRADLAEIYIRLGVEYDLPVLCLKPKGNELVIMAYPALKEAAAGMQATLEQHHLPVLDSIFQYYEGGENAKRKQVYLDRLRKLKPGVTQIIIHCGYDDAELQAITSSHAFRDSDRQIFCDPEVKQEIEKLGIEVITWKQFRELQTASAAGK